MFNSRTSEFDSLLENATNNMLLEPNVVAMINLCDLIRQNDVSATVAFSKIKKKMSHDNMHTLNYTLHVVEAIVKNCGQSVYDEIVKRDFLNLLRVIIEERPSLPKDKALELLQTWAQHVGKKRQYSAIQELYDDIKREGYSFPPIRESEALYSVECAPDWKEGDVCAACSRQFTTFKRRHHCRNCGDIICDNCSTKRMHLPKYGIEKEVRVCDRCYSELKKGAPSLPDHIRQQITQDVSNMKISNPSQRSVTFKEDQTDDAKRQKELELREQEELELAMAISASEAEHQKQNNGSDKLKQNISEPKPTEVNQPNVHYSEVDTSNLAPELAHYLNRNYWEDKSNKGSDYSSDPMVTIATAPPPSVITDSCASTPLIKDSMAIPSVNGDVGSHNITESADESVRRLERDQFISALRSSIDIFVNRMRSNSSRGRSIANDTAVQNMFQTLTAMHPQLLGQINDLEDQRMQQEALQDKLGQIRDAREALNALREDNAAKLRQQQEEANRQRQMQMNHMVQVMRQKKQDDLERQRQEALQRMQDQEREMAYRLQQQQEAQMRYQAPGNQYGAYDQYQQAAMYQQYGQYPQMDPQQAAYYAAYYQQQSSNTQQHMYQGYNGYSYNDPNYQQTQTSYAGASQASVAPQQYPCYTNAQPVSQEIHGGPTQMPVAGYNEAAYPSGTIPTTSTVDAATLEAQMPLPPTHAPQQQPQPQNQVQEAQLISFD